MPPTALTPLALENAPLLRQLAAQDFTSKSDLAQRVDRDLSNLNKTLKRLEAEGLVHALSAQLTAAGANAVRDLERLDAGDTGDVGSADHDGSAIIAQPESAPEGYLLLTHRQIARDQLNPRKTFDEEALGELATSIEQDGLLENLVVRRALAPDGSVLWVAGPNGDDLPLYRLVAGERRWRAIGLLIEGGSWSDQHPILCKDVALDDAGHRRIALIENLQRVDLNPLEEARALDELMKLDDVGTADIAHQLRRTQRFVQQRLQLLKLPAIKQVELKEGRLTVEGARQWLAAQPKPLQLGATQALVLMELAWAISAQKGADRHSRTPIDHSRPRQAPEAHPGAPLIHFEQDGMGREYARLANAGWNHICGLTEDSAFPLTRHKLEPHVRQARLAMLPADMDGKEKAAQVDALFKDKQHLTAWLNPPFEIDPAWTREQRRRENVAAQERREREQQQAEAERLRREREARDAENRQREERMGAAIRIFERRAAEGGDVRALGQSLMFTLGYEPPFAVAWDGGQVVLQDSAGANWSGSPELLEGLRRIMALAVNHMLGLPLVSGPELPETPWAIRAREEAEDAAAEAAEAQIDLEDAIQDEAVQ